MNVSGAIATNPRAFTEPEVKEWCSRRWRQLFTTAAAADPAAVSAASERIGIPGTDLSIRTRRDRREARHRIAEWFLRHPEESDWSEDAPAPPEPGGAPTLVLCPGLINTMLPVRAFAAAFPALTAAGWKVLAADAHPMRSCSANVADLVAAIERGEGYGPDYKRIGPGEGEPPGDVILVGYSKGTADALTMLVERPALAKRVKALYCWGGAVGGSYLADDIYDAIKDIEVPLGAVSDPLRAALRTLFPLVRVEGVTERLDEYDVKGALRDLTTTERARFIDEHAEAIDALDMPIFNLTAATSALEVPYFQMQGYLQIRNHPEGDPENDMQLTQAQARMTTPMATDLAVLRAHHWDISYDAFPIHLRMGSANLDHRFPREAALTAILQLSAELGL
jgi:hypothetical protein